MKRKATTIAIIGGLLYLTCSCASSTQGNVSPYQWFKNVDEALVPHTINVPLGQDHYSLLSSDKKTIFPDMSEEYLTESKIDIVGFQFVDGYCIAKVKIENLEELSLYLFSFSPDGDMVDTLMWQECFVEWPLEDGVNYEQRNKDFAFENNTILKLDTYLEIYPETSSICTVYDTIVKKASTARYKFNQGRFELIQ